MSARASFAALLFLAVASLARPAMALEVPPLRGRVNDHAGLLDRERAAALERKLAEYEQATGHQFALLTVSSLEGDPIEDFAVRAFESWKLGDERRDDGLLFVVARDERRVRIEVGYGLEGAIPDAIAARVIRETVVPAFRAGDFGGGIDQAFDRLMAAGRGEALGPAREGRREPGRVGSFGQVIGLFVFMLFFAFGPRRRRRGAWMAGAPGGFFIGGGGGGGGGFGGGGFGGGGGGSGGGGASGGW